MWGRALRRAAQAGIVGARSPERGDILEYPALIVVGELPEHLRDNPLVALHPALAPEVEATLARLARRDAADDERVAAELVVSVR